MPTLTLTPNPVAPGTSITAKGAGFGSRTNVRLLIGSTEIAYFTTGSGGTFSRSLPSQAAGSYVVSAWSTRGCASAQLAVKVIVVPPVDPPPVPTPGIPPIGPKPANSLLHKDFADGLLFPFVEQVYPNDHPYVPGNDQYPSQYCRYTKDAAHISVHDGYLDLRCTKGSPFWTGAFVATFEAPGPWPPKPTFAFQYGLSEVCAAIDAGTGGQNAAWPGPWYLDPKTSQEIDWVERITGKDTANVRPGPTQPVSRPPVDTGWHVFGLLREATKLTFYLDGVVVGTRTQSLNAPMSLLADSKVGLADPNTGSTPDVVRMRVAWWRVKSL
jgi:hypothetical protein